MKEAVQQLILDLKLDSKPLKTFFHSSYLVYILTQKQKSDNFPYEWIIDGIDSNNQPSLYHSSTSFSSIEHAEQDSMISIDILLENASHYKKNKI